MVTDDPMSKKEGRKCFIYHLWLIYILSWGVVKHSFIHSLLYLTLSTHFIYGYMASDIMVKDHSERGNLQPLPHGLLFPISSKGSFISIIAQTG